ncbi:ABC transporter ATP-binding protein [Derxia lacustris]|uniref:ABC transporter ATP-binding protein n=1 Tax=Derxia lacustris TaxID=764842 RepID=UPI000A1761C0|nr:ABC transporter ATP-binding protein [Derxia lacustris]
MSGAILVCKDLTMKFGGLVALDGLGFDIRHGEVLGLLGPNGSGKTTFFNVVTGVYRASAGSIDFEGREVLGLSPQAVCRAGITRTFQRSRLSLGLSVFDNIMVGHHRALNHGLGFNLFNRRGLARQMAEARALAQELASSFSPTLGRRLDEPAGAVSMIDRRRIEVCRALVSRPRLLLLDEPSAGMTHEECRQLMDDILAVRERMPGLSIVIIEHEMGMIERITDRCVVLNYGRKLCEGSYREVAADAEVQRAYLGADIAAREAA